MQIGIESRGEGSPTLLLHGTPTSWDVLRPIADALPHARTLLVALPGYGRSPAWPGATTSVAIAEAIERAALDAGARRLRVVGFSAGSYHALHLATRGVLEVERVVALAAIAQLSDEDRDGFRAVAQALRAGQSLAGVPTARFLSPAFAAAHPDACARVEAWAQATTPDNLARELDAMAEAPSLLPDLARYRGAITLRTGSLDLATPPARAQAVAAAVPAARLAIVEGSGHALLEEDRDATIQAVVEALA